MISAVILTKNEEENIETCLESLSWCSELIVIDDHSTDKTVKIAQQKGAQVYVRSLNSDFSGQRNFGLEKAKGTWVLFVDPDERVSPALWYEITHQINDQLNGYSGYYLKRRDVMWGKELRHGEIGSTKLLRLGKKGVGKWQGKVHEVWKIKGKTLTLHNTLLHYPHPTIEEFLKEINFYTDLRAQELYEKRVSSYWWMILFFPVGKFLHNFIIRGGFLDGLPGLVFAILMSLHSFLVRGKLWLLWQKK